MSKPEKVTDKYEILSVVQRNGNDPERISVIIDLYGGIGAAVESERNPAYIPAVKLKEVIDGLSDKNAAYIYDLLVERFKRKMIGG